MIEVGEDPPQSLWEEKKVVFRILTDGIHKGIINTQEDFITRLETHVFLPVLYMITVHQQLSYLYGCLCYKKGEIRKNNYVFEWREIGTDDWHKWFTVNHSVSK